MSAQGVLPPLRLRPVLERAQTTRLDGRLQAALRMLVGTPTGAALAAPVIDGRIRLLASDRPGPLFDDETLTVHYTRDFLRDGEVWQHAVILAHELEHARQALLGLPGERARGVREAAAFRVQCRVWVELGGKVRASDLSLNLMNSHDMLAWLDYPLAIVAAIVARAQTPLDLSDPAVRRYWDSVAAEELVWRKQWQTRFPPADSRASAVFVLRQAGLTVSPEDTLR